MIKWLNENQGFVTALLTLVYVVATIFMAAMMVWANRISRRNIETAIHLERQRIRPVVIFDIVPRRDCAYVILNNMGATPALDVEVKVTPTPKATVGAEDPMNKKQFDIGFLTSKTLFLAPNHELSAYLAPFWQFVRESSPCKFAGTVRYKDSEGEIYEEAFALNPGAYVGPLSVGEKDVGSALERISKSLSQVEKHLAQANARENRNS